MNKFLKITSAITLLIFLRVSMALAVDQVYFYYTDPAGTPLAMSDSTGAVVWRADYLPFGEETIDTSTVPNNKMFVGKEKDSESGLHYFGARYMDSAAGRFVSPDPIGAVDSGTGKINQQMLANPQLLNRYSYSINNSYRYIDPNGAWPTEVHNTIISSAFSGKLSPSAIASLQKGSMMTDSQQFQDTAHDYMHAMRAPGQNADEAASLTVSFIADKLVEFKSLMSAGQTDKAYEALGMAMHPLMDATSPSHEGYQVWKGLFPVIDGTTYNAEMHRRRETKDVFNSNSDYSSGSVDAIRSLYDNATR